MIYLSAKDIYLYGEVTSIVKESISVIIMFYFLIKIFTSLNKNAIIDPMNANPFKVQKGIIQMKNSK